MSRVAKAPVTLPNGVEVTIKGQHIEVKGAKGTLSTTLHDLVVIKNENGVLSLGPRESTQTGWMQAGTARAVINNLVAGVSAGIHRRPDTPVQRGRAGVDATTRRHHPVA